VSHVDFRTSGPPASSSIQRRPNDPSYPMRPLRVLFAELVVLPAVLRALWRSHCSQCSGSTTPSPSVIRWNQRNSAISHGSVYQSYFIRVAPATPTIQSKRRRALAGHKRPRITIGFLIPLFSVLFFQGDKPFGPIVIR
jgi:hypothetical protein